MKVSTLLGAGIITLAGVAALGGALIAPHASGEQFRDFLFAPPMRVHLRDAGGDWHAPFVYPLRLVDRVERRYEEDRTRRVPLVWFSEGKLVRARDETTTCCRPQPAFSSFRPRCCCRRSSWRRPPCRMSGSGSQNPRRAGDRCCKRRRTCRRSPTFPGCLLRLPGS